MIHRKVILELAPYLKLGEEKHFNHPSCKAGEDTKARLYIKRVVGGRLAYCHHCMEHGFARDLSTDGTTLRAWLFGKKDDMPRVTRNNPILEDMDITSPRLVGYLWDYGIGDTELISNPWLREWEGQLLLNIKDVSNVRRGYQLRSFIKDRPKYTTHYFGLAGAGDAAWFWKSYKLLNNRKIIVTEDILSAYRIYRDTDCNAVALLKTTMSTEVLLMLNSIVIDKIIIWLDSDEAGKKGATRIYDRLSFIFDSTTTNPRLIHNMMESGGREPKHCLVNELKEIVNGL